MHKTDWDFVFRMGLAFFILNDNNSSVLHSTMHLRICVFGFIWYVLLPLIAMYTSSETSTITFLGCCLEIWKQYILQYITCWNKYIIKRYFHCMSIDTFQLQYVLSIENSTFNIQYLKLAKSTPFIALHYLVDWTFLWMNGCIFAWFEIICRRASFWCAKY